MKSELMLNVGAGAVGMVFEDVDNVVLPSGYALVMPSQTHTSNVGVVRDVGQRFPDTDALVTRLSGIAVGVRTADCVPIVMNAPDIGAVAAVHAGWKGTVGNIVGNTVDCLVSMGADVSKIRAAFGPSICGECYETGQDLALKFKEAALGEAIIYGEGIDPMGERVFGESSVRVDIQKANAILLGSKGILPGNISYCGECTRHSAKCWPSWRRENGTSRRLATVVFTRC